LVIVGIMADVAALTARVENFVTENPGATTSGARLERRRITAVVKDFDPVDVMRLAIGLVEKGGPWRRFFSYEILTKHSAALSSLTAAEVMRLGDGIDSWGAVDMFGCYVSGQAWRRNSIPDSLVHGWTLSTDRWWRRAALVSTIPLNMKSQGGAGDARRTLDICDRLVAEPTTWSSKPCRGLFGL
jgi:hypothetical protein